MDCNTGNIYLIDGDEEEDRKKKLKELTEKFEHLKPMTLAPTEKQLNRKPPRVGRNDPCPCDSGKKFKKCCYLKES